MNAHKIEVVLTEDGTLTLQGLPFHAGEAVEVIILAAKAPQHQAVPKPQLDKNRYPLHDTQPYRYNDPTEPVADKNLYPLRGKVIRYDDPTEPVALEDWEVLQ